MHFIKITILHCKKKKKKILKARFGALINLTASLTYIICLKGIYYSAAVKAGLSNLPDFKTNPGFLPSHVLFKSDPVLQL